MLLKSKYRWNKLDACYYFDIEWPNDICCWFDLMGLAHEFAFHSCTLQIRMLPTLTPWMQHLRDLRKRKQNLTALKMIDSKSECGGSVRKFWGAISRCWETAIGMRHTRNQFICVFGDEIIITTSDTHREGGDTALPKARREGETIKIRATLMEKRATEIVMKQMKSGARHPKEKGEQHNC